MPKFRFTAMDPKGREIQEVLEAENQARAVAVIKERGLFPTSVAEISGKSGGATPATPGPGMQRAAGAPAKSKGGIQAQIKLPPFLSRLFSGRVKLKQKMILTRQLATLLNAGLPLLRGLTILQKQEKSPALRHAVMTMAESVEGGSTFAEAVSQHPNIFDNFFVNMVKAGEASGAMEAVLIRLAEFMEKAQRIRNKVKGAMIYPSVVLFVAIGILGVLMVAVIPKFKVIFADLLGGDGKLPALTQFVMGISETVAAHGLWVLAGIVVFVVLFNILIRTAKGRVLLDRVKISMPILGDLNRKAAIANFTRTLGTLLTGGVPILSALNIVREVTGNAVISKAVMDVHDSVKEGESMTVPLEAAGVFPSMVVSMIQVGEETGALPDMLIKIADTYDEEVDVAVEAMTSIIEPVLIIFLAVVVGTIVIAMFLPLIEVVEKLTQGG